MSENPRLLRITTVPISLKLLLQGQLSFFKDHEFEVLAVSADGPEVEALRSEGICHKVVNMTRVISPYRDLVSLFRLIKIIRIFRPDIVHTHTPKAGLLGMLAAWICRVPVRMHTVAGLPVMERKGFLRALLIQTEKITYGCATHVYPNAKGLEAFIKGSIKTKRQMKMIGKGSTNGINTHFFSNSESLQVAAGKFRDLYNLNENEIVFSFIGRIVKDKGINELLCAFDALSKRLPCKLFLAGPFEDELDPISAESRAILRENTDVITLGYVDDVRPLLLATDIFVFPSYREGFPNVVMQACCMECACIVSDINGCNEIIEHGTNGLIVKPKQVKELFAAMLELANNRDLRQTMGSQARKFIVSNFDQNFIWSELLNEYTSLLGNSVKAR
jgi:glycosyltransferase involved in cell wall biosynthesis